MLDDKNAASTNTSALAPSSGGTGEAGGADAAGTKYTSGGGAFRTELDRVNLKIEKLRKGERDKKYLGLSNQGATCYMNSAI